MDLFYKPERSGFHGASACRDAERRMLDLHNRYSAVCRARAAAGMLFDIAWSSSKLQELFRDLSKRRAKSMPAWY
ncbi:hypothetical protein M8J76_015716 [Diaphorina citri]|nr:hypothetical protein M8J76_015716 [Diaphorina citri]